MEPAGSVNNNNVAVSCLACLNSVKHDGSGSEPSADLIKSTSCPVRPNLELLNRSGAEGIRSAENNASALIFKAKRKLADSCGFADAVYADNEDNGGLLCAA